MKPLARDTVEQLDRAVLIALALAQQAQIATLTAQIERLTRVASELEEKGR